MFAAYCGDLAERRFQEGYPGQQVCDALRMLNQICFKALLRDPEAAGLKRDMIDHITLTLHARLRSCAGGVRGAGDVVGPDPAGGLDGLGLVVDWWLTETAAARTRQRDRARRPAVRRRTNEASPRTDETCC